MRVGIALVGAATCKQPGTMQTSLLQTGRLHTIDIIYIYLDNGIIAITVM